MGKKLFIIIYLLYIALFVYPSSRLPGIDCITGCAMPLGLPLAYHITHGGGIIIEKPIIDFMLEYLIIDIIYWALITWLVIKTIGVIRGENQRKIVFFRILVFIIITVAALILGVWSLYNVFPVYLR